jgi:transposase
VESATETFPDTITALRAELTAARLENEHLKLLIARLRREQYGQTSERGKRLLDQLELQLEEGGSDEAEDEVQAQAKPDTAPKPPRNRPKRAPFPAHFPRERKVLPNPDACPCCGGKLVKLGEDITETLEVIPRRYKVIQTVREKLSCRACEAVTQPPAPNHAINRGRAGPNLLAQVLHGKYALHLPLNRQSEAFAREGVDLDVSTLADWVGACAGTLAPLAELIERHVLAAVRLHGDDTTVPVLAHGKTATARLWTYVRDDRPFGGADPPAAMFRYSRDRKGAHPEAHLAGYSGILQADAYGGYNELYRPGRAPGPIMEAGCWAHARRKFYVLADTGKTPSPLAVEAVKRIDAIFAIERDLHGLDAAARLAERRARVAPLVEALSVWLHGERARLSRHAGMAKATDYMLKRWEAFARFLDDGRICLTNNAAERSLRAAAIGRKNWLFAGSDRGGERAAMMYALIGTAKLNGIDPQAWLADVLARINDHPANQLAELLPWNWQASRQAALAA